MRKTSLISVSQVILDARDLDEVLERIVGWACRLCRCERASILLVDAERHDLYHRKASTAHGLIQSVRVPLTEGSIAGWAILRDETVVVNDTTVDPRHYRNVDAVSDYRTRSVLAAPLRHHRQVTGALELLNSHGHAGFTARDAEMAETLAREIAFAVEIHHMLGDFRDYFLHTVELLPETVERQLPGFAGHHARVADLCNEVGRSLGLADETRHTLWLAAMLHDVGKIRLPVADWADDQTSHPRHGADILRPVNLLRAAAPLVACHHQRGLPGGGSLAADDQVAARILQAAEVFDERWLEAAHATFAEYLTWFEQVGPAWVDADVLGALRSFVTSPRGHALYHSAHLVAEVGS